MKMSSPLSVTGFITSGVLIWCHVFFCMDMFLLWAVILLAQCGQDPEDEARIANSEEVLTGILER